MPRKNPKKLRGVPSDPAASRLVERDDPNPTHSAKGARGESRGRVKGHDMDEAQRAAIVAAYRRK
mgnify:CR=1 FL=1